jgi:D-beta-D-heptose 7-phosphate kinase/D-beta-D-heptose 1-phosphate adenosyltransferase
MRVVWVNGCFDVLHVGHLELLKYAKSLGDKLVVGVDTDNRVKEMKGVDRPINTTVDRKSLLEGFECVDFVADFGSDDGLRQCIELFGVHTMVVGSDYRNKTVIGSDLVESVVFFDRIGDYSTTKTLNG